MACIWFVRRLVARLRCRADARAFPADASAQACSPDVAKAFKFRAIGPTRQSGRFVDFAVPEQDPHTIYAATGSGGLWKSVNNGITWEPIFDNQPVISIGDIAVAPPTRTSSGSAPASTPPRAAPTGATASTSRPTRGKTWTNMGLKDSHHIGRIIIDPKDPDIVYVAALGQLYSENDERGVLQDDRRRQDVDEVARREGGRPRGRRGGPRDGSEEPEDPLRRRLRQGAQALDVQPGRPRQRPSTRRSTPARRGRSWPAACPAACSAASASTSTRRTRSSSTPTSRTATSPACRTPTAWRNCAPASRATGMIGEEVYRSDDGGKTWRKVSPDKQKIGGGPGYYYMQIRDRPERREPRLRADRRRDALDRRRQDLDLAVPRSAATTTRCGSTRRNSKHIILGYDHGMGITYDARPELVPSRRTAAGAVLRGRLRQHVALQRLRRPAGQRLGARPEHQARRRPIVFEDWQTVGGGDGFYNEFDTVTNRYLYNESQFGAMSRIDLYTGETKSITNRATRRCASTGTRRSSCRRTTATSSTTAPTSC